MSHRPYRCGDCRRDSIANPDWFTNLVRRYSSLGGLPQFGESNGFVIIYCGCRGWD